MKVMLHLREGVSPARFLTDLRMRIRSGEIRAWEVTRSKPSTVIRREGRFKTSPVLLKANAKPRRPPPDHRPADVVASLSGKDAVLVLRYFVYLLVSKLGEDVEGFYVPIEEG
ncbi:MAG TPA: hypothetical protein VJ922_08620 [Actinomycetota bacterium]|nr:hypothetical protein [Actinomycetota bacterium]